jgi:glycosyltransferase involved in cell wall biosynthesis
MRLLMIASSFSPVVGGGESFAADVCAGLAGRGHRVTVATDLPRGAEPGDRFDDPPGVEVRRLSRYRALLEDPDTIRWEQMAFGLSAELAACGDATRPELILTNSLDAAQLGKMLALEFNLPWVAAFHEHAPEEEPLGRGRLRLVYEILHPSLVLAGSRFYAERARRWSSDVPLELVHHGVDTEAFHPGLDGRGTRERYGFGSADLVVVSAGRLKPRKGLRELVEAFALVRRRQPRARLLIVGSVSSASTEYAAQLERDIERLGIQDVVVIDRSVGFDRMPSILAAADAVAQPSFDEGLGLALLEAMSAGRAVVATSVRGHREILTEPDLALVVPPGRPSALAEALCSLLGSAGLRQRLGERARDHVEDRFSRRRMVTGIEAALRRVLDSARSRTGTELANV